MKKRTDPHRPGAIIPGHYQYVLSYALHSGDRPAININCEMPYYDFETEKMVKGQHGTGPCCVLNLKRLGVKWARTGKTGKCSVCGANYTYGDVWVHQPTGEHINIGHECAHKYSLLADRSEFELSLGRAKDAVARVVQAKLNAEARAAFLAAHPGLEKALKTDNPIILDIADKFRNRYTSLSDAQVALVFKLTDEVANPKSAEAHIAAPEGRVTFHAVVVSVKTHESQFGNQLKMTVKTATPEGSWLAWGTVPRQIKGSFQPCDVQKGDEVDLTATLLPGREAHFAFMKRPVVHLIKKYAIAKAEGGTK